MDHVSGTERWVSSRLVSSWTLGGPTIVRSPYHRRWTEGVIGLSTPNLADTEIFQVTLQPGQSLDDTFSYVGDVSTSPDFDVYLYDVTAKVAYNGNTLVARAATGAGEPEHLTYRNQTLRAQRLRVVVVGYTIITNQRFAIAGTPLGAPVDEGIAAVGINL